MATISFLFVNYLISDVCFIFFIPQGVFVLTVPRWDPDATVTTRIIIVLPGGVKVREVAPIVIA